MQIAEEAELNRKITENLSKINYQQIQYYELRH
jgi:hypothetical protein